MWRSGGDLIVPQSRSQQGRLIIKFTYGVPQHLAHHAQAFHPAKGMFHRHAKTADEPMVQLVLFTQWMMFARTFGNPGLRMFLTGTRKRTVANQQAVSRKSLPSATLIEQALIVPATGFGGRKSQDSAVFIREQPLLAGVPFFWPRSWWR